MNKYMILAVLLVGAVLVQGKSVQKEDKKEDSSEENVRELAEILNKKFNTTLLLDMIKMAEQTKAKCPDLEEKLDEVSEKIEKCVDDVELGSETFCSLINKNLVKCTKPAIDLIASCLPEESKDLPVMLEKMLAAVVKQACSSTVEEVLELMNPCALEKDFASYPACKEIKTVIDEHKNKLPSKSLICSTMPKVRNCAKAHIEGNCQNTITRQAALKFHDAIDAALKDDCDALNKA
ncbi:uncharacterized protein LOC114337290 isoform X1 [Diabrotica virgifera virgifera]|uniref:Uncharacterized protein LOC114337290 n=1 Tax=Diabrotica virgifera virgifera TaxID=50390 RepID=A0A6P7GI87_DIAVI|nr:uncharacterized protein LOC114337290 isoform X1 [Diabrotica virgifera virgifera]